VDGIIHKTDTIWYNDVNESKVGTFTTTTMRWTLQKLDIILYRRSL